MTTQRTLDISPRLLGVKDSAAYLGATVWFVRSIIWNRQIPFLRLGKRLVIDRVDLDAFIVTQKQPTET